MRPSARGSVRTIVELGLGTSAVERVEVLRMAMVVLLLLVRRLRIRCLP